MGGTGIYTAKITSTPIKVEVVAATALLNDKGIVGEGTAEAPFEICNEQDLTAVRELVGEGCSFDGSYFLLKESIELSSEWKPIGQIAGKEAGFDLSDKEAEQYTYTGKGTKLLPFSGIFDGNQKTITTADGGLPLFGVCRNASVKNLYIAGKQIAGNGLVQNYVVDYGTDGDYNTGCPATITIENVTIKSGTSTLRSGFLSGFASGANTVNIVNCVIEDDVTIGYNKDQSKIGSFAGQFNGNIINSKSAADVYGVNPVGGLVGCKGQSMGPCTVKTSSFTGNVYAGGSRAGGIIGSGYDAESAPNTPVVTIRNCFVAGNITGATEVSGILGSEPVCEDCWANGQGSIVDNVFYGVLAATDENAYIGGIIGFMKSYNANQTMDNNYYVDTCGVNKGIGAVEIVGVPGFDLSKCGTSATVKEMSDETIAKKLNSSATSFKNWVQDTKYPVHSAEPVVYAIELSGTYKTDYVTGDTFSTEGMVITGKLSEGSTKTILLGDSKLKFTGYNMNKRAVQTVTVTYGVASTSYEIKVLYNDSQVKNNLYAYFTLLGDEKHPSADATELGGPHTLSEGNLDTWIGKTKVTITNNTTEYDVFKTVLTEKGMTWEGSANNQYNTMYISGVQNPNTKAILSEFDNGPDSGWMYTLNGVHSNLGVAQQFLNNGDVIVFHYTDDYTKEEGSDKWGVPGAVEEVKEVTTDEAASTTTSPTDVKVSEKTNADGTKETVATVTVSADNQKEILAQAKANKSKEIILQVSKDSVKDASKADVQLDKSINEMKDMGYTVKYRFYRSTKKSSGYKAMLTKTSKTYTNTSGKKGTKYYYKVQVRVYDENGKCVAKTALKQCKYACRIWSK